MSDVKLQKDVSQLSTAARLEAMELLWASLSREQEDMDSPEWHGKVLAARQAKVDSGKGEFLTFDLLRERLRR